MKVGGQILWNVTPICETSQIYYLRWRRPYERRSGPPFKGSIFPFGSLVEYHPITAKDQSRIHQFGKKVLPGLFLGYALYAGEFGKVTYWLQTLRSWRRWTHRKSTRKDSMQKSDISQTMRIYFPIADGTNEDTRRRSGTENIHLGTASTNSRRGSHWLSWRFRRVSSTISRLTSRCRWSYARFLVHVGKLHLPPSRFTQSQIVHAERRIIPYSTNIFWCYQNYSYEFGC